MSEYTEGPWKVITKKGNKINNYLGFVADIDEYYVVSKKRQGFRIIKI